MRSSTRASTSLPRSTAATGLMHATGGKQSTADSLMCKNGVNLKLIREDNTDNMQAFMMSFAERHKAGEAQPKEGAHFVAIMGDGGANFLKGLNDRLVKLGDEYLAVVVGSAGYSRGEDKFMGPPSGRPTLRPRGVGSWPVTFGTATGTSP